MTQNDDDPSTNTRITARLVGIKDRKKRDKTFSDCTQLMKWMKRHGRYWWIEFQTPKGRRILQADITLVKDARTKS